MLARRVLGRAAVLAAVAPLVLVWSTPVAAQQPADPPTVARSIEMGVEFLKTQQKGAGHWGTSNGPKEGHNLGYTALVGLTLVECGVPTTDPRLKAAAQIIRANAQELDSTYELALAILFIDRMQDKKPLDKVEKNDKRVIQLLAGRLISAQMPSGGWGYKTHKYPETGVIQLVAALNKLSKPPKDGPKPDADKLKLTVPADMRRLAVWDDTTGKLPADPKDKRQDLYDATTDNSNTHFAMLGLWAARKYDIPVDRTFALVARRFRNTQGGGGTWSYDYIRSGGDGGNQFTCIALLGVAIGHVVSPPSGIAPEADPVILNAFAALVKSVGEPVGDTNNRPTVKAAGGLYFLWAMERIAVLYDIQKLGKKDWYQWGAEILVCNQKADGAWSDDGGYPGQTPVLNTCFALLFLKRANLTPDLGAALKLNTAALTAKVDDKIAPKVEPKPEPKVETTPTPKVEEPPPKKEEPKVTPTPVVTPAPAPDPEPTPAPKKSPWLWIVLGVALAGIVGGGLVFLVVKNMNKDEDEEKPKKKKKIKSEGGEGGGGGKATKKVKQDVELDDD